MLRNWFRSSSAKGRRSSAARRSALRKSTRVTPQLEQLEDRRVMASLTVANGTLFYTAGDNVANNLSISYNQALDRYRFVDTAEPIFIGAGVAAPVVNTPHDVS